jgi:flavin reductase
MDARRSAFLDGMSRAACTVSVVTPDGAAGRAGVTVSVMASVSADAQGPCLLVCIHEKSPAAAAIAANCIFCGKVLGACQAHVSDTFAGRIKTADGDKFAPFDWGTIETGAPALDDAVTVFDCRVKQVVEMGTHKVVFGDVVAVRNGTADLPLIHVNRHYGAPAPLNP